MVKIACLDIRGAHSREAVIRFGASNLPQVLRGHWLARSASWLLFGQGTSIVLQAANFILLARLLRVEEYGIFAGAFALVSIVTPYSSLGSNMLFMRYVSADRSVARTYWGNGLLITALVSVLIGAILGFAGPAITSQKSRLIFIVLVAGNCLFWQVVTLASAVFQTFEKMKITATLTFLTNLARLAMVLGMLLFWKRATALEWSFAVLIASGLAAIAAVIWVEREIGWPRVDISLALQRLWEGFGFGFAGATQSVYNDVDKTMLSHYGMTRENGFYTLAYRVITVATAPVVAIDSSVLPRYFRMGRSKMKDVVRLATKSAALAGGVGLGIALAIRFAAPWVPRVVGKDYSGAVTALTWLCWIPLLRGIHQLTGGALTGMGYQNRRTAAQFTVAALNFLLNLWWIPAFGWIGAAWSSVASDGTLAVLNVLVLAWTWRVVSKRASLGEDIRKLERA